MYVLHRLLPKSQFRLPPFELAPLEFGNDPVEEPGELLLDVVIASIGPIAVADAEVQAVPTPGEMQASTERHLRDSQESASPVDAAEELRNALAELRRAIR